VLGEKHRKLYFLMAIVLAVSNAFQTTGASQAATPFIPNNSICNLPGTILGTSGNDTIVGTDGDDVICGLGGKDKIDGRAGNDIIIGGNDIDTIIGGPGNDEIVGGDGDDTIAGGDGKDQIWGSSGDDSINGDGGEDYISGGSGSDNLFGDQGADQLFGEDGNDSLNGGTESDSLNGGSGLDVCDGQSGDILISCFFDKAGPTLKNIAISPEDQNFNSTDENRKLHFRFTLVDPGTGSGSVNFTFGDLMNYSYWSKANQASLPPLNSQQFFVSHSISNVHACDANQQRPDTFCRISGTSTYGVYDASATVPRNMITGKYKLVEFGASDLVSNSTEWGAKILASKKLAVIFNQTGTNDRSAPTLNNFEIISNRTLPTNTSTILAKISFNEIGGNALGTIQADYRLSNRPTQTFSIVGVPQPSDLQVTCPNNLDTVARACLFSGSSASGTAVVRFSVSAYGGTGAEAFRKGTGKLVGITISDGVGNEKKYSKFSNFFVAKNLTYESFGMDADSDHTPPTLLRLTATKSKIDTSLQSQTVIYTLTARDSGKGLNSQFSWVALNVQRTGFSSSTDYCKTTSTKNSSGGTSVLTVTCNFPAHFTSGTFDIEVFLIDSSSNSNSVDFDSTQLRDLGFPYQLVNG
jgi:hypothetical protein